MSELTKSSPPSAIEGELSDGGAEVDRADLEDVDLRDTGKLVLNPAFRVMQGTDDEIVVRNGSRGQSSMRLSDGERRGILGPLVRAFAQPLTRREAQARFAGIDVADLLDGLVQRAVIIEQSRTNLGFLSADLGAPAQVPSGAYAIVGTGRLADWTHQLLDEALGGLLRIDVVPGADGLSDLSDREDPDVIVCVSDTPNLPLFFDVNEYALTTSTPWHCAYLDGTEAVVGPLFLPGATGCYHDLDIMDEAGRSMRVDHMFGKLNTTGYPSLGVPGYVSALAASMLVTSIMQHACGVGSYLEGYLMRIDLGRMEFIRQQLSRLARCPACMVGRPDLRHPFL